MESKSSDIAGKENRSAVVEEAENTKITMTSGDVVNELEENARPELAAKVPDMQDYDVIFLGYSIWWSDMLIQTGRLFYINLP